MIPISAVIIAYNEASIIRKTVEALSWCNEIVVIDSGSTDGTQDICRRLGCKVIHQDFLGYGLQKQKGIEHACNDWILSIDADEVVTLELKEEIEKHLSGTLEVAGFYIPRTMIFMGRRFKYGGESNKPHLCLFDSSKGNFSAVTVHEKVILRGATINLKNPILHYSYKSIDHYFQKFNVYTSNGARELFEQGKRKSLLATTLRLPLTFIKIYFFQGCFLNGFPGFVWSVFSAFYPFVKYVKLHVLDQTKNPNTFPI